MNRLQLFAGVVALALAGCASAPPAQVGERFPDLPRAAEVAGVPFYPQDAYYCGPAALAMAVSWSGAPLTQAEAATQVYTPGKRGALQNDMIAAARRNGTLALPVGDTRSLLTELAAGHPVIVFQNLGLSWLPDWHYAVAFGYDLRAGTILLHSGGTERQVTTLIGFERTWRAAGRWALVLTRPTDLAATATERAALEAAVGLELAGRNAAAADAYATILQHWPESFAAAMGLGNARYATADYMAAIAAFDTAGRLQPTDPAVWNNLAYALAASGRGAEARAAADRAVQLAPAGAAQPYRETVAEIAAMTR